MIFSSKSYSIVTVGYYFVRFDTSCPINNLSVIKGLPGLNQY